MLGLLSMLGTGIRVFTQSRVHTTDLQMHRRTDSDHARAHTVTCAIIAILTKLPSLVIAIFAFQFGLQSPSDCRLIISCNQCVPLTPPPPGLPLACLLFVYNLPVFCEMQWVCSGRLCLRLAVWSWACCCAVVCFAVCRALACICVALLLAVLQTLLAGIRDTVASFMMPCCEPFRI